MCFFIFLNFHYFLNTPYGVFPPAHCMIYQKPYSPLSREMSQETWHSHTSPPLPQPSPVCLCVPTMPGPWDVLNLCHRRFHPQLPLAACRRWHTAKHLPKDWSFQTSAQSSSVMEKSVISTCKGTTCSIDEHKHPQKPKKCPK